MEEYFRVRQSSGIHNLYKFRLGTTAGDTRVTNIAIAPLVSKDFSVIGRLIIVDDITERIELESQLIAGRKAVVDRTAGGGSSARSEHSAGGDFVVRADACRSK